MYGYIYKTTNLINQKIYIGQHHSEKFDESYKGSGKLILKAIKKYGWNNFTCETIEWCETPELLDEREIYYIDKYCSNNKNHYNIAKGGNSGDLRKYLTEEELDSWKSKISKAKLGVPRSIDSRLKQSQTITGHKTSEETKQKISAANMGHPVSDYVKQRVSETSTGRIAPNKGIPASEQQKAKQKAQITGRRKMTDGNINKYIKPELFEIYLNNGWKFVVNK